MTNRLFYGDDLDVLRRRIASGSVDLCYIDPPFNSKRNYFQIYTNAGTEDRAQAQAFVDTWTWGADADEGLAWITDLDRLNASPLTPHAAAYAAGGNTRAAIVEGSQVFTNYVANAIARSLDPNAGDPFQKLTNNLGQTAADKAEQFFGCSL